MSRLGNSNGGTNSKAMRARYPGTMIPIFTWRSELSKGSPNIELKRAKDVGVQKISDRCRIMERVPLSLLGDLDCQSSYQQADYTMRKPTMTTARISTESLGITFQWEEHQRN